MDSIYFLQDHEKNSCRKKGKAKSKKISLAAKHLALRVRHLFNNVAI